MVNPPDLYQRNDPYIHEHLCEIFPDGVQTGDTFTFRVTAFNIQGSTTSAPSAALTLAGVPTKPASGPVADAVETNGAQIKVVFSTVSDDGGSPLLSYELQMGSLTFNDFKSIAGSELHSLQTFFTVTQGIEKGAHYAFRYRAVNQVGAGEWSDTVVV